VGPGTTSSVGENVYAAADGVRQTGEESHNVAGVTLVGVEATGKAQDLLAGDSSRNEFSVVALNVSVGHVGDVAVQDLTLVVTKSVVSKPVQARAEDYAYFALAKALLDEGSGLGNTGSKSGRRKSNGHVRLLVTGTERRHIAPN
jgi:hypothetical protein